MAESRVAARLRWIDACRARYQNCGSLEVPAEALESWTEHELTMFFESMGMIKPQTAAEKALADAQWREKLITEKEERLWRSAEAEGVALVVREIDREAEKRAHKALARARAWTAVELAARPRRWRRAGVRSRSKSPDPARRITKRDVDRARSRTRGRARLEDSDSDSSSSSEEEWRPRGIQPRAVRLMLAAEAAPAVHFRSRRRKLGVFDLARRAACRAVLARPPADGHFYAPMDGIVDTAAAVAEETAWLAFGTRARQRRWRPARGRAAGMTRVVLTPLAPSTRAGRGALDEHGRTLLALERARAEGAAAAAARARAARASPRRDGDGYDSGESVGSASLLGAVRCPEWDDPWELNAGPPKTWLARLPRQGLGVLARAWAAARWRLWARRVPATGRPAAAPTGPSTPGARPWARRSATGPPNSRFEPEAEAAFDEGPWLDDDADHGEAPSTAAARPPAGPPTRVALSPRRDCVEVRASTRTGAGGSPAAAKRTPAFDGGAGALGLRAALATVDVVSAAATAAVNCVEINHWFGGRAGASFVVALAVDGSVFAFGDESVGAAGGPEATPKKARAAAVASGAPRKVDAVRDALWVGWSHLRGRARRRRRAPRLGLGRRARPRRARQGAHARLAPRVAARRRRGRGRRRCARAATRREGRSSGAPTDAWFQWRQAKRRTPLHGRLLLDDEAAALAPEPAPGEAPEVVAAAAG
ncbi:ubiquitin-protein transferase [Aureococcus anophagefferens]|uniref:Ubiquitin-protein transferase n=1 Tax=Aureococcus anophagefferens TaxID=44056 RepID=A0ABR1FKC7_AURAN